MGRMRYRKAWGVLVVLLLTGATLAPTRSVPAAGPIRAPAPAPLAAGAVVGLMGTAYLWVADDQGVLHFAGDPRALIGRRVDWSNRVDLATAQLAVLPQGEPWLSAALVQIGSAIYLPQWNSIDTPDVPTLRHIAFAEDLALLGVNAADYGQVVLDAATWERQYGLSIRSLPFGGDLVFTRVPPVPTIPPESIPEPTNVPEPIGMRVGSVLGAT